MTPNDTLREMNIVNANYAEDMVRIETNPSPLGIKVARMLGVVLHGLHVLKGWELVDWTNTDMIRIEFPALMTELATFDNLRLTELVFLCHDAAVRLSIWPRNHQNLVLEFTERQHGNVHHTNKHPTLEEAVASFRLQHPLEA